MSPTAHDDVSHEARKRAALFAALGDETRLALLTKLSQGSRLSIARLSEGSPLTRQAITKHLHVLHDAGLVSGVRKGRESLFQLEPKHLDEARRALDAISRQWDEALGRLKSFVEAEPGVSMTLEPAEIRAYAPGGFG